MVLNKALDRNFGGGCNAHNWQKWFEWLLNALRDSERRSCSFATSPAQSGTSALYHQNWCVRAILNNKDLRHRCKMLVRLRDATAYRIRCFGDLAL